MFQAFSHYSEKYHLSKTSTKKNERYVTATFSVHLPTYTLCTSEKKQIFVTAFRTFYSLFFMPEDKVLRGFYRA